MIVESFERNKQKLAKRNQMSRVWPFFDQDFECEYIGAAAAKDKRDDHKPIGNQNL
jgi:hypothetical protein